MDQYGILKLLHEVRHPGRGDRDIVELGMVNDIRIDGDNVTITLAFPGRKDPLAGYLEGSVRAAIYRHLPEGVNVEVKTVVKEKAAAKNQELGTEEIEKVAHIIGIASGKGGVGKSTVAVNLAVALARMGYRVGLADADVYGPSVPTMTGTVEALPGAVEEEGKSVILPIEKFGVKWMSIGYFAQKGQALIWRGPMASSALKQLILQVRWGELDFLLIDMPPGTGDIHISLVNDIPMEGAVVVTTPQEVALADVAKAIDMFRNEKVDKKVFGIVENMAWFTPEEYPDHRYYLFGKDGGLRLAGQLGLPLLGQIPIVQGIRESGDSGEPAALSTRPDALAFLDLAGKLASAVNER